MTKIQHFFLPKMHSLEFYFTNWGLDLGCWVFANTDKAYFYCLKVKEVELEIRMFVAYLGKIQRKQS